MIILDYVLLAILAYFTIWGLRKGLIQAIGSIVGLILAIVVASRYFEQVTELILPLASFLADNPNLTRIIVFVLMLIVINRVIVFLVGLIYKAFSILPFIGLFNRILGGILGLLEGAILLGLVIFFASRFPFGSIVESFLADSQVAPYLISITGIVQPFIPEAIKQIQGLI